MRLTKEMKDKIACALEIISDPKRWTRGAYARDAKGKSVPASWLEARRFCAIGALRKCGVTFYEETQITNSYRDRLHHTYSIVNDNDGPGGRKKVIEGFTKLMQEGEELS